MATKKEQEQKLDQAASEAAVTVIDVTDNSDLDSYVFYDDVEQRKHQKRKSQVVSFVNPDAPDGKDNYLIQGLTAKEHSLVTSALVPVEQLKDLITNNVGHESEVTPTEILTTASDTDIQEMMARQSIMRVHIGVRRPKMEVVEVEELPHAYVKTLSDALLALDGESEVSQFPTVSDTPTK